MVLALPAIAAVLAAVGVLLMLYYFRQGIADFLEATIGPLLRGIPIVGGQVHDAVASAGATFGANLARTIDDRVQPLVDLLDFAIGLPAALVQLATDAARWAETGIGGALTLITNIGHQLAAIVADLLARIAAVGSHAALALSRAAELGARVATIIGSTIPAAIARAVALAQAWALGRLAALEHSLRLAVAAALSSAAALVAAEQGARIAGDAAVRAQVAAELAAAEKAAAAAIAGVTAGVATDLGQLEHGIEQVGQKVGEWAGPLTIAATVTATVTELERMRQCTDPMCSYLSPQLDALSLIADAATAGLLAELVAAAVHDPKAAAADVLELAGPLVGGARTLYDAMTGSTL